MALDFAALSQAQVQTSPYPHFVVPKILSDEAVAAAIKDYPQIDMAGIFPLDTIEGGPGFRKLIEDLQSPEVRRIIDQQYTLARSLIEENSDKMHVMAKALLEWETIDAEQIDDIMAGKEPRAPKDWTPRVPPSGTGGGSGGAPAGRPEATPTVA